MQRKGRKERKMRKRKEGYLGLVYFVVFAGGGFVLFCFKEEKQHRTQWSLKFENIFV